MNKRVFFLLIFILLGFVFRIQAQTEIGYFDILYKGRTAGTLTAKKAIKEGKIIYTSYTNLEVHLLTNIKMEYSYNVVYNNGVLENASVKILVNGHLRTDVNTVLNDEGYTYYSRGEEAKIIIEKIQYSIEKLSFEEPVGITKIYAEEHGTFHDLKKIAIHTYLKTAPNGHKNTYYYKDDKLQKSDIDTGVITFSIVRKN